MYPYVLFRQQHIFLTLRIDLFDKNREQFGPVKITCYTVTSIELHYLIHHTRTESCWQLCRGPAPCTGYLDRHMCPCLQADCVKHGGGDWNIESNSFLIFSGKVKHNIKFYLRDNLVSLWMGFSSLKVFNPFRNSLIVYDIKAVFCLHLSYLSENSIAILNFFFCHKLVKICNFFSNIFW